ncbi:MAG TPA: polysaccharide deacetylase family protein [Acidimicrobiia bacterium]|nr:polysaccharide deacetylase family protein [Acidimicrobiia bacterium]
MLKSVAVAADRVRTPARGVVVLIYHRVGGHSGLELDLPRSVFADQLAMLAESGRVVTLDAALDALARPGPTEPDPVVLTFDDGTRDFVDVTVPLLVEHGIPATVYVATAFIEDQKPFPYGAPPLSWAGLADAASTGLVTVGSHTHSHALLDRLPADRVDEELDTADELIAHHVGVTPRHFAYPKALAGSAVAERAVRARYRSAALAGTRANVAGATDPYRLARSPVQRSDAGRWFDAKLEGGMALEDDLRRVLNRLRYSGAQE